MMQDSFNREYAAKAFRQFCLSTILGGISNFLTLWKWHTIPGTQNKAAGDNG